MKTENIKQTIIRLMKHPVISELTLIQPLWAGHGNLYRARLQGSKDNAIIIKEIKFDSRGPHKYNKKSQFAQRRKKESYQNELLWYKNFNYKNSNFKIPYYITSEETEEGIILILEDLKPKGFLPIKECTLEIIKQTITWLANLHATYLNKTESPFLKQGNYWNLSTRPDEFKALSEVDKKAAQKIDQKLTRAKFQTLIHGDAKLANFLRNISDIAGVDFQYIGTGAGIIDLMYFLSSINDKNLAKNEKKYLNIYFDSLEKSLKLIQPDFLNFYELKAEWQTLYNYAWADFYRFLIGWNPHHYKVNDFTSNKYHKIFNKIDELILS